MGEVLCRHALGEISANTCYTYGCRQPACAKARKAAKRRTSPYRPAEPTQKRIRELLAAGWTQRGIAHAAGLEPRTIRDILNRPPTGVVQAATERLIRHVPTNPARPAIVDATATRRRLQALATQGWGADTIHTRSRVAASDQWRIRTGRATRCYARTETRIADLYDQLWDQAAPDTLGSRRARSKATRMGWQPPMAWDDETIADSSQRPKGRALGPRQAAA